MKENAKTTREDLQNCTVFHYPISNDKNTITGKIIIIMDQILFQGVDQKCEIEQGSR